MCYQSEINSIQPTLKRYVKSRVFRPQDAEDIVQNTNIILINKEDQYDENKNFQAWVFTIAFWQIRRYFTDLKRSKIIYFDDPLEEMCLSDNGRVKNSPFDKETRGLRINNAQPKILRSTSSPLDIIENNEQKEDFINGIKLSKKYMSKNEKSVFDLSMEDYKNQEISKMLNIKQGSVSAHKFRAMKKIKRIFNNNQIKL